MQRRKHIESIDGEWTLIANDYYKLLLITPSTSMSSMYFRLCAFQQLVIPIHYSSFQLIPIRWVQPVLGFRPHPSLPVVLQTGYNAQIICVLMIQFTRQYKGVCQSGHCFCWPYTEKPATEISRRVGHDRRSAGAAVSLQWQQGCLLKWVLKT